ncbi:MAG: hypothetical protein OHK0015_11730 [Chloroflexi bacterium OHK40]
MMGYALFLVPMVVAFWILARRHGIRQALLDLIGFNLFFAFDFAALLPGEINLQLIHVLLVVYLGYEVACIARHGRIRVRLRYLVVLGLALLIVGWVALAAIDNRLATWGPVRVINYVVRIYLLSVLFLFVGAALARPERLRRFLLAFCLGGMAVGAIAVVQTASAGRLLTGDTTPRYLGVFQPEPLASFQARMEYYAATDYINQVRTLNLAGVTLYRAYGSFTGAIVSLCVGALIALCLLTSPDPMPRWMPAAFFLMAVGVGAAFVRTLLATFVLLAAFVLVLRFRVVLTSRRTLSWLLPIAGIMLIVGLFLPPVQAAIAVTYDGFFGARAGREFASLNGRVALWAIVIEQIRRNPLFGTSHSITMLDVSWGSNANPEFGLSTHNSFLEVAYHAGVLPALILIWLYAFCLYRAARLILNQHYTRGERRLFLALLVSVMALTLVNQTGDWMNAGQVAALFWIICGCLATYPRPDLSQRIPQWLPPQSSLAVIHRP